MHTYYTILSQKKATSTLRLNFSVGIMQLCYVTFQDNSAEIIVEIS